METRKATNRTKKWWLNFQGVLLQPLSRNHGFVEKNPRRLKGNCYWRDIPIFHRTMSMGGSGHVATILFNFTDILVFVIIEDLMKNRENKLGGGICQK